jgi:hypothetical protein
MSTKNTLHHEQPMDKIVELFKIAAKHRIAVPVYMSVDYLKEQKEKASQQAQQEVWSAHAELVKEQQAKGVNDIHLHRLTTGGIPLFGDNGEMIMTAGEKLYGEFVIAVLPRHFSSHFEPFNRGKTYEELEARNHAPRL